ncbi:MAG: LAGLIDADG family homing endonuclease [Nanoarchaeota archaeon]
MAGDSLIYTDNGWKKIKEVNHRTDKVLSFNVNTKEYEWSEFVFLRFENKDKLLKITLHNGYELIVTKDHPLLLPNMQWKKAHELSLDDNLTISYNLPSINTKEIPLALARLLGFTISDGSLNKRERRVEHSRGGFYNSNRQRFRYFSIDNNLLQIVQRDLKELFNCTPTIIYLKNRCIHIQTISQQVCGTLNFYGVPFGSKSAIVEIPSIILEASDVIQREFLKALFSGDGTVNQQTYLVEYYSNSKKLLQQISYILHQDGISCRVSYKKAKLKDKYFDSYRLSISNQENLTKFYYKIGFYSLSKQEKLKIMLQKYVKNMGVNDLSYLTSPISKIEEVYEPFVYDLTVPNNHNFIANGIISHNTGKTLSVQYVTKEILKRVSDSGANNLKVVYLNCKLKKIADTEYRILAEIISALGESVPATGLPTDAVYSKFIEIIERKKQLILIVMDEIDQAVKKISDGFLYNLTRLNSELKNAQISLVGISNSLTFMDHIDPRVRSSLGEEELVFAPYNALQLQDILRERANQAFAEGVLDEGVFSKCAAFAAREHGDARRALDLLRVAGELAERENSKKLTMEFIDKANNKIERDKMLDIIENEPRQHQLVLYSILNLTKNDNKEGIFTGNVYNKYQEMCQKTKIEILTQRRVSDIIAEFDMLGLINVDVISRGRMGRTREIKLMVPENLKPKAKEILETALNI